MKLDETTLTAVRRKDRQVDDDAFIRSLLHSAPMGTLATVQGGQPFINTNIFVYDEAAHVIFMHTARTGRTSSNVVREARVCFSVSEMGRLLPSPRAFNMSVEYKGVAVLGRARLLTGRADKLHALDLLVRKYFPHLEPDVDYAPPSDEELKLTAVYHIDIDGWSGKMKRVEDDFPGAFLYGDRSSP